MNNTDKATSITRTSDTVIVDNASYTTHCGNKTKVASYNNCKNPLLIKIELDKVAPPYLHILLSIALKHHKLLEEAAHKIDVEITKQKDEHLTELGKTVKTYMETSGSKLRNLMRNSRLSEVVLFLVTSVGTRINFGKR